MNIASSIDFVHDRKYSEALIEPMNASLYSLGRCVRISCRTPNNGPDGGLPWL